MLEKKTVLNLEPYGYSEAAKQRWAQKGYKYVGYDEEQENLDCNSVFGIIVRLNQFIGEEVISRYPKLKFVVSATTGWDHLDIEEFKRRGITLYSLRPHKEFLKSIPSTAEHTWALLMALMRHIPSAHQSVREGTWDRDSYRGHQLASKVLGVVGMGRTGLKVAHYASAFDMDVQYYDPYVSLDQYTKRDSLVELVGSCDILSLHIHLNEETEDLISDAVLKNLKKGTLIINTSRGKLWDESALVEGLKSGRIGGVATDVVRSEMSSAGDSELLAYVKSEKVKNVIVTPHIGGATWEAMWSCEEFIVDQVE